MPAVIYYDMNGDCAAHAEAFKPNDGMFVIGIEVELAFCHPVCGWLWWV